MLKILIVTIFIFLISCSEELIHPSPPVWAEKSRPEDLDERGIDAHNINLIYPDNNSIKLTWHPNLTEDIWKYHLYRTDVMDEENNPIDFSNILTTENDTLFYDDEVDRYVEYYYYLKAENFDGINSAPSDTISYELLYKPQAISDSDSVYFQQLQFQWIDDQYSSHITSYYTIKVENESGQGIWSCLFLNPDFLNNGEIVSYLYSLNGSACVEHHGTDEYLDSGKYYWKIKPLRLGNGITTSADHDVASAESNWVEINIID
jgi:hypothetical protein